MKATPEQTVEARRQRLREWIDTHYAGTQAKFVAATGINQGELSGLLKSKSFGEKKAAAIEAQANMPPGYLVVPLAQTVHMSDTLRAREEWRTPPPPAGEVEHGGSSKSETTEALLARLGERLQAADPRTRELIGQMLLRYAEKPEDASNIIKGIKALLGED